MLQGYADLATGMQRRDLTIRLPAWYHLQRVTDASIRGIILQLVAVLQRRNTFLIPSHDYIRIDSTDPAVVHYRTQFLRDLRHTLAFPGEGSRGPGSSR